MSDSEYTQRPRLLDLFCGAGGAAMGYHRAGFEVVGVDIHHQPNYPFEFIQSDALELAFHPGDFDAIHASPPCQAYSTATVYRDRHADLYATTRTLLQATGLPYVIENVIGAPYRSGFILCGSMFGMRVRRHRNFESSELMLRPECRHEEQGRPITVTGEGGAFSGRHSLRVSKFQWGDLMGMPWATPAEIAQAIPPAYTEWIGSRLLEVISSDV